MVHHWRPGGAHFPAQGGRQGPDQAEAAHVAQAGAAHHHGVGVLQAPAFNCLQVASDQRHARGHFNRFQCDPFDSAARAAGGGHLGPVGLNGHESGRPPIGQGDVGDDLPAPGRAAPHEAARGENQLGAVRDQARLTALGADGGHFAAEIGEGQQHQPWRAPLDEIGQHPAVEVAARDGQQGMLQAVDRWHPKGGRPFGRFGKGDAGAGRGLR